jgi:D-alanine--poly(phosphoribitol) ligase subunit 1
MNVPLFLEAGVLAGQVEGVRLIERATLTSWQGDILDNADDSPVDNSCWVRGEDLFYILFTSGSSGTPKGVEITANCVSNFLEWALTLGNIPKERKVFINQAPFSFDLSVFELTMALASGGCLFALTSDIQQSLPKLFFALANSTAHIWVSTPSFATLCLRDQHFSATLLPQLELFLFCGEVLAPETARELKKRFPHARIVNSYGPTESTVAVTQVLLEDEHLHAGAALPVGRARPGTRIEIRSAKGDLLPAESSGEIYIVGNTVARGYFGQPQLSAQVFCTITAAQNNGSSVDCGDNSNRAKANSNDHPTGEHLKSGRVRSYRSGDLGYLDETGMLYYQGRLDSQVKLNGYRIELSDIEANMRALDYVLDAVVLPVRKDARIKHLTAYVTLNGSAERTNLAMRMRLKRDLSHHLPTYMIPKRIVLLSKMPLTANGKIDCNALLMEDSQHETT